MACSNSIRCTIWHGGRLVYYPKLKYKDGEHLVVNISDNEFEPGGLAAIIEKLGYEHYNVSYIPSFDCSMKELFDVVDDEGFINLRRVALSNRSVHILIKHNQRLKGGSVRRSEKHIAVRKSNPKFSNCTTNLVRFVELVGKLNPTQRGWVNEMGFVNLLHLSVTSIDPSFISWIVSRYDPVSRTLNIRENYNVIVDCEMVGWVLGVPGWDFLFYPEKASADTFKYLKKMYKGNSSRGAIKESKVYADICAEKYNKAMFKQHFLLYTLGVLLCPMMKGSLISSAHVYVLQYANMAYKYNWAKYMLDWLTVYSDSWDKQGCGILLIVLIYLDKISHASKVEWKVNGCRICSWNEDNVSVAIQSDSQRNGVYGKAKVIKGVVYGSAYPVNSSQETRDLS